MKFSIAWQINHLKKLMSNEMDILRFTDDPESWFQNEAAEMLKRGDTPQQIYERMQKASDWAYEYGSM